MNDVGLVFNNNFSPVPPQNFFETDLREIAAFHGSIPGYAPTPLRTLDNLAALLGLSRVYVKDESFRFGLNSFKALGAVWAMRRISPKSSASVFAAATDGNHGRGVAWAASRRGSKAIIHMPLGSSPYRVNAIRDLGAECVVTNKNYDDTVADLARQAHDKGWVLIQDTAWQGYEQIPSYIMEGYATIALELRNQLANASLMAPTHVILQAGVGSFAGALIAAMLQSFDQPPRFILVEPWNANCIYRSLLANSLKEMRGSLETIMAGLACGKPNPLAWPLLRDNVSLAMACPDWIAASGMRMLGSPLPGDERVISGESGAAPAGAMMWLMLVTAARKARAFLELGKDSRILLISTEGATDPLSYRKITWLGEYPAPEGYMGILNETLEYSKGEESILENSTGVKKAKI